MATNLQAFKKQMLLSPQEQFWFFPTTAILERCPKSFQDEALDIGYETGNSTLWFALNTGALHVSCVDISSHFAPLLKEKINQYAPSIPIQPARADGEYLPFHANSFGSIFCRSSLQYMNISRAFSEILRVLRPGGRAYIIANLSHNPFVNLFRMFRKQKPSYKNYRIIQYLNYSEIREWHKLGNCQWHREFYFFIPLFYPLVYKINCPAFWHWILGGLNCIEYCGFKILPFLRRYCWYSCIEIIK